MKTTRNRDCERRLILLDMLRERFDHPTAAECVTSMRKLVPSIGSSTIYRHLGELVESGLITEHRPDKGPARFDANIDNHAHFYCIKCRTMIDVEKFLINALWPGKAQNINCLATGLCNNCKS